MFMRLFAVSVTVALLRLGSASTQEKPGNDKIIYKYVVKGSTQQDRTYRELTLRFDKKEDAQKELNDMMESFTSGLLKGSTDKWVMPKVVTLAISKNSPSNVKELPPEEPPAKGKPIEIDKTKAAKSMEDELAALRASYKNILKLQNGLQSSKEVMKAQIDALNRLIDDYNTRRKAFTERFGQPPQGMPELPRYGLNNTAYKASKPAMGPQGDWIVMGNRDNIWTFGPGEKKGKISFSSFGNVNDNWGTWEQLDNGTVRIVTSFETKTYRLDGNRFVNVNNPMFFWVRR